MQIIYISIFHCFQDADHQILPLLFVEIYDELM